MDSILTILLLAGLGRLLVWAALWKVWSKEQGIHPIYREKQR